MKRTIIAISTIAMGLLILKACTKDEEETKVVQICTHDNTISQERLECTETLSEMNMIEITESGGKRIFTCNHIPDHKVGPFPNENNPNTIKAINETLEVTLSPSFTGSVTQLQGANGPNYAFGIALNGIEFDPVAAEPWGKGTDNQNWDWNLEAMNNNLGFDCNLAHVQPNGEYHYHGTPAGYFSSLNIDGTEMKLVGYAADGFPVYYKYGYSTATDAGSGIKELTPSYALQSGIRPGDGITAPCESFNGKYVQDYEYVSGSGDLDECNGRTGVTPEYPGGTYYYVITDEFPGIPRCLQGTPDPSFSFGPPN